MLRDDGFPFRPKLIYKSAKSLARTIEFLFIEN
jgi:hypothetical protein